MLCLVLLHNMIVEIGGLQENSASILAYLYQEMLDKLDKIPQTIVNMCHDLDKMTSITNLVFICEGEKLLFVSIIKIIE